MTPWDYDWDDWVEPAYPMVGPAFDWTGIRYLTIHYPGSPKVLPLGFESERDEIRREQRMYTDDPNRGYSVGYNAKIFQNGHRWKLRGDTLRCAANGNQATNIPGFAIQIRVAIDETPTAELIDAVRSMVAWAREKAGRHLVINGHRDLKPTACPGDKAYALIQQGVFEPVEAPIVIDPPVVNPPPTSGTYPPGSRDVMYPIDYGIAGTDSWWTEMAITPKGLQWSGGPSPESQEIRKIFVAVPMPRAPRLLNDADVINLMQTIGTFGDCPSTFLHNVGLREAWQANLNQGR